MLKPFLHEHGTSEPVRDGLLPVHHLVLHHLPATLRASTLTMMRYTELVMRPSTEVITLKPLRGKSSLHAPRGLACDRTFAFATAMPPWLVARHHQWKKHTRKPARKAISTPAGVRAHGAPLGVGNRYGGRDWVDC